MKTSSTVESPRSVVFNKKIQNGPRHFDNINMSNIRLSLNITVGDVSHICGFGQNLLQLWQGQQRFQGGRYNLQNKSGAAGNR